MAQTRLDRVNSQIYSPELIFDHRKPILYQDLVDMVIDNIQDDKKALSSASLIARCWVKGSQKYLHNTISVTPRTDTWLQPGPTRQFERYTSPRIAQLVKNVLIRFNGTSFSREEIKVVVSRLTHVRNLILDNIDKWPQKGDDFNFEFDYLESLSITHSSFQDSKDFFHVLSLFPTIQIFVLLNVVWSSEDEDYIFGDPIPLPPDIPGSLIHQIIYGENNDELKLIDVLHQWFRAITLEGFDDIHFVWEGSFPDALGLLTDELGPDLTCLTLKFGNLIKDETLLGMCNTCRSLQTNLLIHPFYR